jgi:hypothetical protein
VGRRRRRSELRKIAACVDFMCWQADWSPQGGEGGEGDWWDGAGEGAYAGEQEGEEAPVAAPDEGEEYQ